MLLDHERKRSMRLPILSDDDKRFIRYMAERWDQGQTSVLRETVRAELGFEQVQFVNVLETMYAAGYLQPSERSCITLATLIQAHRQSDVEARQRPSIVSEVKDWAHRSPLVAWPILGLSAVGIIATVTNQVWSLVEKISAALK